MLRFGIAGDAAPGTIWILERSTGLQHFEEIYRFDGTNHLVADGSSATVESTGSSVAITDTNPPAGAASYRIPVELAGQ